MITMDDITFKEEQKINLDKIVDYQNNLLSDTSHEFKTPLNQIISLLKALIDNENISEYSLETYI